MSCDRCAVAATSVLRRSRDIEDPNVVIDDIARRRGHVATIDSAEEQLVSVEARDLEQVKRREKTLRRTESLCRDGQCLSEPVGGFDVDDLEL